MYPVGELKVDLMRYEYTADAWVGVHVVVIVDNGSSLWLEVLNVFNRINP